MTLPPKPPLELPRSRASSDPLADEALAWIAHLHSGSETAEDWARFDAWKTFDAAHEQAAAKAQKLWDKLGTALLEKTRRRRTLPIVAVIVLGAGALLFLTGTFGEPRAYFAEYQTSVGEIRKVALRDGSTVELDSTTSFDTDADGRGVDLYAGQIYVSVAPDAAHPFKVRTAGGTITALGTAFIVRNDGGSVRVAVSESAVKIAYAGTEVRVHAGQGTRYSQQGRVQHPTAVDLDAMMAWRNGEITFQNQPLTTVIKEMQRYQRQRLIVLGGAGDLPVTGLFDVRNLDTLLTSLERALPIKVMRLPGFVLISVNSGRDSSSLVK